jgi:hypothetical protein
MNKIIKRIVGIYLILNSAMLILSIMYYEWMSLKYISFDMFVTCLTPALSYGIETSVPLLTLLSSTLMGLSKETILGQLMGFNVLFLLIGAFIIIDDDDSNLLIRVWKRLPNSELIRSYAESFEKKYNKHVDVKLPQTTKINVIKLHDDEKQIE